MVNKRNLEIREHLSKEFTEETLSEEVHRSDHLQKEK